MLLSISDNKPVEALGVRVLVADHTSFGSTVSGRPSLDFEKVLQVLEESHLLGILDRVVLDVLLVRLQVVQDAVLLSQLRVEEVGVALEFRSQLLIGLVYEFALVADSLQESFVDLRLDVVVVVLSLVVLVVIEHLLHIFIELFLLLIEAHHNIVVVLLSLLPDLLYFLHLRSSLTELLDLGCQLLLSILYFGLNFHHNGGDLLEGLILEVVVDFLLVGDALDLLGDV